MRFEEFFQRATSRPPYRFQSTFAEAVTLPDLLEAPTGTGKTATAVLGWLWRRTHGSPAQRAEAGRRLVFCLPMRTLVQQTEENVLKWRSELGMTEKELGVHVMLGGAVDSSWDEHPERNAILIGTQDQLLSRALLRGYGMSRFRWPVHFAWLNSDCTWVLDEVQLMGVGASTAAQLQAFRERLGTIGSCKTVWMTATLDEGRLRTVDMQRRFTRQTFDAGDNAGLVARVNSKKRLQMASANASDAKSLGAEVAKRHIPGTLTLVVINRVARAQELFRVLEKTKGIENVALIHSRFRPCDRGPIQAQALSGKFHGVIVATQAIEAGVDISARTLFTELAPWSSLVQRFGRLNRAGEWKDGEAAAWWIDLDLTKKDMHLPYAAQVLEVARERLSALEDVGPASLALVARDSEQPELPVLRRKDLLELFDTEPDLAGHDIDIARYIRATDERDVQVAWRVLGDESPSVDAPALRAEELCRVPFFELEKLLEKTKAKAWRFDSLRRAWVEAERLFPGLVVVVDVKAGGYSERLGFTKDKDDQPASHCPDAGAPEDDDSADYLAHGADEYVTLQLHASDTAEEMASLTRELAEQLGRVTSVEELEIAARFHDLGKAHHVFQEMLTKRLPAEDTRRSGGPWAKSDGAGGGASPRRFFRHELVSALAWLREGRSDLGAFIIAAHHGKVRVSLRARPGEEGPAGKRFVHGVWDGDSVPAVDLGEGIGAPAQTLSLACMELGGGGDGPSWADRMLRLLEQFGPFQLAYLEALIRVADWRASARRSTKLRKGNRHA